MTTNFASCTRRSFGMCAHSIPNSACDTKSGQRFSGQCGNCEGRLMSWQRSTVQGPAGDFSSNRASTKSLVCYTSKFDQALRGMANESTTGTRYKWFYYAQDDGSSVLYPGVLSSSGSWCNWDPPLRPWYIPAANGFSRNIVLMLDGGVSSRNSDRFCTMLQIADHLIDLATPYDKVTVMFVRGTEVILPKNRQLVVGNEANREALKSAMRVQEVSSQASINFAAALSTADAMISAETTPACVTFLFALTDTAPAVVDSSIISTFQAPMAGIPTVFFAIQTTVPSPAETGKVLPSACSSGFFFAGPTPDEMSNLLAKQQGLKQSTSTLKTVDLTKKDATAASASFPRRIGRIVRSVSAKIRASFAAHSQSQVIISERYVDHLGGGGAWGSLTTVAAPVFANRTGTAPRFLGVVALDFRSCELDALIPPDVATSMGVQWTIGQNATHDPTFAMTVRSGGVGCTCLDTFTYRDTKYTAQCATDNWYRPWCAVPAGCGRCGSPRVGPTGCWDECDIKTTGDVIAQGLSTASFGGCPANTSGVLCKEAVAAMQADLDMTCTTEPSMASCGPAPATISAPSFADPTWASSGYEPKRDPPPLFAAPCAVCATNVNPSDCGAVCAAMHAHNDSAASGLSDLSLRVGCAAPADLPSKYWWTFIVAFVVVAFCIICICIALLSWAQYTPRTKGAKGTALVKEFTQTHFKEAQDDYVIGGPAPLEFGSRFNAAGHSLRLPNVPSPSAAGAKNAAYQQTLEPEEEEGYE
eukprot:NODE_185_length_2541_cov_64.790931_g140_i0.p1 GENE.NODE_185_length_2541_cov_64.790931_g140_i0~~NODE_185_length_2541_cov_64.790931_g140_i0.p1  ORF type:complete len:808 (+),score=144.92 NODE_185_length_2541_cov_64.790931_g140_i0:151-2424(+)